MKNKKTKTTKVGVNRKKVPSDVSPTTSLPPLVEGQLRCFLRVTISRVLWTITKPPQNVLIRIRWWGESTSGTLFHPRDGSLLAQKGIQSTARFPVRCGPKQFTSYLTDMGTLVLDVLTKPDHLPVARAQIKGLSRLSLSNSISGFFTVVSPTSEKMGELQVTVALEPLAESYDSSSSVPTPDVSLDVAPKTLVVPPATGLQSLSGTAVSRSITPRGLDYLYFQERQKGMAEQALLPPQGGGDGPTAGLDAPLVSVRGAQPNDLLSALLERGSKLREAMVMSSLRTELDCDATLKDTPLPLPKDNIRSTSLPPVMPSSGRLFHQLLNVEHSPPQRPHSPSNYDIPECTTDSENRAVDLLLGSINGSLLEAWDGEGSPPASLSAYSSVCLDSELNDPQYDESLLENLFYKAPKSDSSDHEGELENSGKGDDHKCTKQNRGPKDQPVPEARGTLASLSLDRVTSLGAMRLARVTVHSLAVPPEPTTPQKPGTRGRPPRPLSTKRCTYFVEYVFPASPSSQTASAEVSRVASSKITGGAVKFLQRIVFPAHFSGAALEQWWQTELTFKIFSRKNTVKKPLFLGTAAFPLRSVLESEGLAHTASLAVQGSEGSTAKQEVGPLKVSVQLAEDSQDFTTKPKPSSRPVLKRTHVSPHRSPSPSPLEPSTSRAQLTVPSSDRDPPGSQLGRTSSLRGPSPAPALAPGAPASVTFSHGAQLVNPSSGGSHLDVRSSQQHGPSEVDEVGGEGEEVLLHALLMVPDGKDLSCGPYLQPPNVYLNCKLFGSDEMARSVVSWGQTNPSFSFTQVAPVPLSHRLLERMKNNVLVIEVWQRAGPALQGQDQLLGLVKLPLHQFYMSFRDSRISQLLLQAQYPVIAVDSHTPIVDVFSGSVRGSLRVLLAMGLAQQIIALQRAREEEMYPASQAPRPSHLLDRVPAPPKETKVSVGVAEALTEHVFVVRVEKVRGLAPLQATVWGEADCYIQYSFPTQEDQAQQQTDPDIVESSVTLKQFRTSTTLCVPDPLFGHSETHVLLVPPGVPVQKILLSTLSSQGLRNGGGIQFEVWCRYYYPNVRDQHVAKGLLLLPKLCGMVTLQRQLQQTEPQLFSLPLIPRTEGNTSHQPPPSGFLDVSIQYKHRPLRSAGPKGGLGAARFITLMVQIHRAAGLKAAARAVASADPSQRHFCEAGVNAYVSLQLSFLSERERERRVCTRVVASSFCPEFSHVLEVPCSLLSQREGAVTRSLAEQLHDAHALFTVHHRRGGSASRSKEAVLGTITIPLADIIHKRTGISGWFGLLLPQDVSSSQASHSSVGGLELSIGFAHHSDRDRMIKAARAVGWEPNERSEDDLEDGAAAADDDDDDVNNDDGGDQSRSVCVSVAVPRAWLPLHCLLQPEDGTLLRSTYCYFRYKLYDRDACCSDLRHPTLEKKPEAREGMDNYDQDDHDGGGDGDAKREDEGSTMTTVVFEGGSRVGLRCSQPLRWYLREERLEVQVWVAQGKGKGARPCDTDRLVGSAFVDLSTLATASTQKQTISGVYPLFRRSAADLSGAAVRVHITMTPGPTLPGYESDPQAEQEEEEEEEEDWVTLAMAGTSRQIHKRRSGGSRSKSRERPPMSEAGGEEDSFGVTVSVDRAMHLSMKGCPLSERAAGVPGYCVSYATAGPAGTVSTHVVQNSSCPVWDHQLECRLSKQLLLDPQQSLVFKVWHKGDVERVIGFVTVDLSPLLSGFQSVCGWYNITDFSGQCQGQLKVAIAPLRGVHDLRRHRQTSTEEGAKDSSAVLSGLPLCYQTTGVYSAFPSHISRYPEQRINTPPHHLEHMLADRSSGRQEEHGVSHQCPLQGEGDQHQQQASQLGAGDADPSRSVLFSALRRNLSELDDIQRYFSRKLISPPFPSSTGRGDGGRGTPLQPQEERRDSDTDTQQLLLKSSRLVGQVNSIINGMSDCQGLLSNISGLPPRPTRETCPPAADHQAPSKVSLPPSRSKSPDTPPMLSPRDCRTPEVNHDPLLTSYDPVMTQHELPVEAEVPQSDTREPASVEDEEEEEEEDDEVEECLSEEELEEHDEPDEERVAQDEDDYEDDEDFEETLLEPRTLNEITSMTDRTSPWTSVVDDADLGSLDGLAEQEQEERPSCDLPMRRSSMEEEEMGEDVEEEQEEESRVDIVESSWTKNTMPYTIKTLSVLDSDAEGSDGGGGGGGSDANDTLIESSSMQQRSEDQSHGSPPLPADLSSWPEGATAALTGFGCQEEEEESLVVPVSGEGSTSPKQHSTGDVEQEQESEKLCDVLDMPNFFLPTQHLEASMRALRLAPTFPLATTELEASQGIVVPRRTRPRPRFTPSAANREETKRIAKIFASHFKDDH